MILISNEDFIEEQKKSIDDFKLLVDKMETNEILAEDYRRISKYIAIYLSKALVGEPDYDSYLYYTNKLIGDKEKTLFFTEPHTKEEIRKFIRESF